MTTVLADDLGLVGADERSAAHHVLTCDHEPIDPMRAGKHEPGHRIRRALE